MKSENEVAVKDAEFEVTTTETLTAINTAEIDMQVATAKRWPRDMAAFKKEALAMATSSLEMAGECVYTLSRRGEGSQKPITGPSIRLAEILLSCWGNVRAATRIVGIEKEYVVAQGVVLDVEKNSHYSEEVTRSIMTSAKKGVPRRFSTDMIHVTAAAAKSIALRNAVFRVVPKGLTTEIMDEVYHVIRGDSKSFGGRVHTAMRTFEDLGVPADRVLLRIGRKGIESINPDDLVVLRGILTAVKLHGADLEEEFPGPQKPKALSTPDDLAAALEARSDQDAGKSMREMMEARFRKAVKKIAEAGSEPPYGTEDAKELDDDALSEAVESMEKFR